MRIATTLSLSLLLSSAALAQQAPTITTTTDYGVLAVYGQATDFDAVATGTAIIPGTSFHALAGGNRDCAAAHTAIGGAGNPIYGVGVSINEHGSVCSATSAGGGIAGTSDSAPGATSPNFGAHGLQVVFAVAAGNTGKLQVFFDGDASANAGGGATIDVDGDGQPDFSARANGQSSQAEFNLTAGANGVVLDISTVGHAALRGAGREQYGFRLSLYFNETPTGPSCNFTTFGLDCGAHIDGMLIPTTPMGRAIEIQVTLATPNTFGLMFIGAQLATPLPLPGSNLCDLLVDPRGPIDFFRVDANGDAVRRYPFHRAWPGIDINFQAVTIEIGASAITLAASNGLNFLCQ